MLQMQLSGKRQHMHPKDKKGLLLNETKLANNDQGAIACAVLNSTTRCQLFQLEHCLILNYVMLKRCTGTVLTLQLKVEVQIRA